MNRSIRACLEAYVAVGGLAAALLMVNGNVAFATALVVTSYVAAVRVRLGVAGSEGKVFFSEEKKQKTFARLSRT